MPGSKLLPKKGFTRQLRSVLPYVFWFDSHHPPTLCTESARTLSISAFAICFCKLKKSRSQSRDETYSRYHPNKGFRLHFIRITKTQKRFRPWLISNWSSPCGSEVYFRYLFRSVCTIHRLSALTQIRTLFISAFKVLNWCHFILHRQSVSIGNFRNSLIQFESKNEYETFFVCSAGLKLTYRPYNEDIAYEDSGRQKLQILIRSEVRYMKISLINQQAIVWGQFILCAVDMYKSGNLNPPTLPKLPTFCRRQF